MHWRLSQGKSHDAHAAMLYAGKAVAGTILRLMEDPKRIEEAKAEHAELTKSGYECPIPMDVKPPVD